MAEERVKIAEIDIGVDKILAKAAQTKKEIAQLQESQKKLKKDTDNLKNATQEQLEAYTLGEIELKKYKKEVRDSQKVLDAFIYIQNQDIRTKDQARDANRKLIAIANQLDATNEDQAATLKKVNAEIDKNTDFIKDNASEYEKTKINIGNYKEKVTEALKESGLFGQEFQRITNISQTFAPVFNTVRAEFKQGAADIRNAKTETQGMTKAQKLLTIGTNASSGALKIFRASLMATGLGIFVVLLGSLVTYLTTTQEGIDKVNRFLTPLKEIMGALLGLVQDFGKDIFEAFSNPKKLIKDLGELVKQNLINRFEGFVSILNRIINFDFDGIGDDIIQTATGVENASEKVSKLGSQTADFFATAAQRGREMADLQIEIEKGEIRLIGLQSDYEKQIKEQNKIAEDQTKTQAEREAAAKRSIELSEELLKEQTKQLDMEIELAQKKTEANDTSREDEKEIAELQARRNENETRALELQTTQQNKLNTIRNQIESERTAAQQAALQRQNEIFDAELKRNQLAIEMYKAKQGFAARTSAEELKLAQDLYQKELEIEQKKLAAKKITQEEFNLFVQQKQNELGRMQAELAVEIYDRELEAFKKSHEEKIKAGTFLNEELFQQERNRLNAIAEAEREAAAFKLKQGTIDQVAYNEAINAINEKNYQDQEALRLEREAAKKEKQAFELEMQRELEAEQFQNQFDLERAREQQRYEARIAEAQRLGADLTAIEALHAANVTRIEKEKQQAKIAMYSDAVGSIAKLLGEQTALGKGLALAQALINTYQGITAALTLPFPANIAAAATTGATGFEAVKNITKTKVPKAAQGIGMDINGPSHGQGGVTLYDGSGNPIVEAQGGEKMVILKREASRELDALSYLNQKHGGVSLSKPVSYAANGGAIIKTPTTSKNISMPKNLIDYDLLAVKVADANKSIPNPIVDVKDVNTQQKKLGTVTQGANV